MDEETLLEDLLCLQNQLCDSSLKLANLPETDDEYSFALYEFVEKSRKIQAFLAKQIAALPETDPLLFN